MTYAPQVRAPSHSFSPSAWPRSGWKLLFFASSILTSAQLHATESPSKELTKTSWKDEAWDNFKSPVSTDAKYYLLSGAALTTVLLIFEDQIIDPLQDDTAEDRPLGRYSKFGDLAGQALPNALYIGGMLGYGLLASDKDAKQNASSMFQASLYSILVSTTMKYTIREKRPNTSARDSFPSGHTTSAFAFASYVGCRHSLPWGIAAYAMAGLVGYSRINDNRHYLHDVVAGATLGGSFGLGVCLAENARQDHEEKSQQLSWYFAPASGGALAGLSMRY